MAEASPSDGRGRHSPAIVPGDFAADCGAAAEAVARASMRRPMVMRSEAPDGRTAPKCKAKPRHFGQERHSRLGLQATCHQHGRSFRQARKIATMCLKFGVHPGNPGLTVFLGAPAGLFGPIANARQHAYCRLGYQYNPRRGLRLQMGSPERDCVFDEVF